MPIKIEPWPVGRSRAVVFNTEAAYYFLKSGQYRADVAEANDIYCDGAGLAIYARLRFGKFVRRRNGPDLMRIYLDSATNRKICLFGGSELAHRGLRQNFPDFFRRNNVVADTRHIAIEDYPQEALAIAKSGHDDVLIFLGLKRQESFQFHLHASGFDGSSIGLGAAIDFLAGTKERSGKIWQTLGFEWLPRLVRESRMWPRVIRSFSLFLLVFNRNNVQLMAFLFGKRGRYGL
jgi:N-acetylglucosaminyldiphosphoundecaprenol N-acetyl-beta-D-mannosaminyltransferase